MALREILASFGFDIDSAALTKGMGLVDQFKARLVGAEKQLSSGAFFQGLTDTFQEVREEADEVRKASARLGVSAGDWQRLQYVSGLTGEQLSSTMRILQKNIAGVAGTSADATSDFIDVADEGLGALAGGGKKAQETLKKLDVQFKEADGSARPVGDIFEDVARAIGRTKDPAERTALAMKIFGRQGTALIPVFSQGEEAISALGDQFDSLGGISDKTIDQMKQVGKATKLLNLGLKSIKSEIAGGVAPIFIFLAQTSASVAVWFKKLDKSGQLLRITAGVLGIAFLSMKAEAIGSAIAMAAAWLVALAPLLLTAIAIEDIYVLLTGGKSALGDFITTLFGEQGESAIADARRDFKGLLEEIDKAEGIGGKLKAFFGTIGEGIVRFIVESLPEAWGFFWADMNRLFETGQDGFTGLVQGAAEQIVIAFIESLYTSLRALGGFGDKVSNAIGLTTLVKQGREHNAGIAADAALRNRDISSATGIAGANGQGRTQEFNLSDWKSVDKPGQFTTVGKGSMAEPLWGSSPFTQTNTNSVQVNVAEMSTPEGLAEVLTDTLNKVTENAMAAALRTKAKK